MQNVSKLELKDAGYIELQSHDKSVWFKLDIDGSEIVVSYYAFDMSNNQVELDELEQNLLDMKFKNLIYSVQKEM